MHENRINYLEKDGTNLRFIRKKWITYYLCQIAVSQNIEAFNFVPDRYKNEILRHLYFSVQ